ncbi:oxygenase MpaB family protein [Nonomuraea mesophila]|uniref:oxygenase MpaB family protein n=1 Tax=Nonomuraea mesophila TaxID=2530382 RepID=UPI0026C13FCF
MGAWQNSDFQDDPFGRLRRTADFVGRVTFGSPEEAGEIGRRVRGTASKGVQAGVDILPLVNEGDSHGRP